MALERMGLGAVLEFAVGKAIGDMDKAHKKLAQLEKGFKAVGKGTSRVRRGFGQIGQSIKSVTVPAIAAITATAGLAIKRFAELNDSMAVVRTIWPKSEEKLQDLRGSLQELAIEFGKKTPELAAASYQALSASVPADEMAQFVELTGRTAVAGLTDMTTATDALTTVVNAYGDALGENLTTTQRAQKASDLLLKVQEKGKATLNEMGRTLGFVVPLAAKLGVSMEDVGASIATLTAVGNRTSTSMTSLRQVIATIAKPTKKAQEAAEKYNLQLGPAALKAKGFSGVLADMVQRLGDNEEAFGEVFDSVEAFGAIAALSADGASAFNRNLAAMRQAAGATDKAFEARTKSITFQWQRLTSAIGVLSEQAGQAIVQGFGIDGIGGLADVIRDNLPQIVAWIRDFVQGMRAGFRAAWETLKPLLERLRPLAERFGLIGDSAAGTAEKIGFFVGKLAGILGPAFAAWIAIKPILGVLGGIVNIAGGVIQAFGGIAKVVSKLGVKGSAAAIGIGAVTAKLAAIKMEHPGLMDNFRETVKELDNTEQAFVGISLAMGPIPEELRLIEKQTIKSANQMNLAFQGTQGFAEAMRRETERWVKISMIAAEAAEKVRKAVDKARRAARLQKAIETGAPIAPKVGVGTISPEAKEAIAKEEAGVKAQRKKWARVAAQTIKETEVRVAAAEREAQLRETFSAQLAEMESEERKKEEERRRKRCLNVNNKLNVDGSDLNVAESRAKLEITERGGGGLTPWQRRQVVERGAVQAAVTRG